MSEYDILLRPTAIKEQWFEVPGITTCGVNKQIVRTWEDVIECGKQFGYSCSSSQHILSKELDSEEKRFIHFRFDGEVFVESNEEEVFLTQLSFNKMVLFMLLLEGKL